MILRDVVRTLPSGAPIAPGTEVRIYREGDDLLLDTVTTDANGMFEYTCPGNPGAVRYEVSVGAGKKIHTTRSVLPVADLDLSGIRPLMHMFLDGVVVNYKDALTVTSDGLSMNVKVGPGVAVAEGVIYRQDTVETIAIPPAVTHPRIDTIAVRFYLNESGDQIGRCELFRSQGTEGVTPAPPSLFSNPGLLWETPLADVRVDPGAIGIAMGKVTDRRLIAVPFIPDGMITGDMLADDVSLGIPQIVEAGKPETAQNNITQLVTAFGITVASNGSGSALVMPVYGGNGSANSLARSDHFHLFPRPSIVIHDFAPTGILSSGERELKSTTFTYPSGRLLTVRSTLRARLRGSAAGASYYRPSITINGNTRTAPAGDQGFWCVQGVPDMCVWTHTFPVTATGAAQTVSAKIMHHAGSFYIDRGELEVEIFSER